MFLIKLVGFTPKGDIVQVHHADSYRYEPDYDTRGGVLLSFARDGDDEDRYSLRYVPLGTDTDLMPMHYSSAFIMNADGKTIEIIRATREPDGPAPQE